MCVLLSVCVCVYLLYTLILVHHVSVIYMHIHHACTATRTVQYSYIIVVTQQ